MSTKFNIIFYLIIFCVAFFFLYKFVIKKFKLPKIGSLALVSGGVKCGKSTFAVYLAINNYKSRVRRFRILNFFRRLFKRVELEEPLLYSNIPLSIPYVPITEDLLLRKKRFVYGSIVLIDEASLVADSMCIKDNEVNENLLLFNKLFGHETKGGKVIYSTQCVGDCHYSIKRCLSEYFYIHHLVRWLPFFLVAFVKECRYSDDGTIIQAEQEDTEDKLKKVLIKKSTWKKFDAYCFSYLTDSLPVERKVVLSDDLKAKNIVSFKPKKVVKNDLKEIDKL